MIVSWNSFPLSSFVHFCFDFQVCTFFTFVPFVQFTFATSSLHLLPSFLPFPSFFLFLFFTMSALPASFLNSMSILQDVRIPEPGASVFKDECMFCHDTPYSPEGLFVSLNSFRGYSRDHVALDHAKSRRETSLYLNIRKVAKPQAPKVLSSLLPFFFSFHFFISFLFFFLHVIFLSCSLLVLSDSF